MDWTDDGIVLGARRHGENALVLSVLTRAHGRHAGLVRGGFGAGLYIAAGQIQGLGVLAVLRALDGLSHGQGVAV